MRRRIGIGQCRRGRKFATAAVLTMLVAGLGSTSALAQEDVPPTYLAPADGASWPVRTKPVFRVQTFAGEVPDDLWVHISKSPRQRSCGAIADDVELEPFRATADPIVYEAKPKFFDYAEFWMNTPGTYYWQVHRISYAGGADGCIEGPVWTFTIVRRPWTDANDICQAYIPEAKRLARRARRVRTPSQAKAVLKELAGQIDDLVAAVRTQLSPPDDRSRRARYEAMLAATKRGARHIRAIIDALRDRDVDRVRRHQAQAGTAFALATRLAKRLHLPACARLIGS